MVTSAKFASNVLAHRDVGSCPKDDQSDGWYQRDPECPACNYMDMIHSSLLALEVYAESLCDNDPDKDSYAAEHYRMCQIKKHIFALLPEM